MNIILEANNDITKLFEMEKQMFHWIVKHAYLVFFLGKSKESKPKSKIHHKYILVSILLWNCMFSYFAFI